MAPGDDSVEAIIRQWKHERPDLDATPMAVFGRIARIHALKRQAQDKLYAEFSITYPTFDMLANLRRSGAPYRKSASALAQSSMISTGGTTFRLDGLEAAGYIRRFRPPDDRRMVYAELTTKGLELIDRVMEAHLELEHRMLSSLNANETKRTAHLLAKLERSLHHSNSEGTDSLG